MMYLTNATGVTTTSSTLPMTAYTPWYSGYGSYYQVYIRAMREHEQASRRHVEMKLAKSEKERDDAERTARLCAQRYRALEDEVAKLRAYIEAANAERERYAMASRLGVWSL